MDQQSRTLALVGPGRAGTTIALALADAGWTAVAVAGRAPDAASTSFAAACLSARATLVSEVGVNAGLAVIATPDRSIEQAARTIAPSLEPGALVIHLAGSRGVDAFAELRELRPDVRVGALHPLQSFPSTSEGVDRLPGSWAAIAGDPQVADIAADLQLRAFELPDGERARYHAAAVVASNHVVALLGQVERLAKAAGVPFEAFWPLVRTSAENAFELGPADALTGPVSRGDLATVEGHLAALDSADRDSYRALAREAARLTGRRDSAIDRLLDDMRSAPDRAPDE